MVSNVNRDVRWCGWWRWDLFLVFSLAGHDIRLAQILEPESVKLLFGVTADRFAGPAEDEPTILYEIPQQPRSLVVDDLDNCNAEIKEPGAIVLGCKRKLSL
jgi:hypothetical protein